MLAVNSEQASTGRAGSLAGESVQGAHSGLSGICQSEHVRARAFLIGAVAITL